MGGLQAIVNLLDHVNDAQLRSLCEYPPRKPFRRMPMQVAVSRPSIYVAGWYRKYERGLTQTPWHYSAPGETSVSEIISEFLTPHFKPIKATFTSGGREVQNAAFGNGCLSLVKRCWSRQDIDVRMLGNGRPFALIMENPRILTSSVTEAMIKAAEDDVNRSAKGRVEVLGLKVVPKTEIDALKSVVRSTLLHPRPAVHTEDAAWGTGGVEAQEVPLRVLGTGEGCRCAVRWHPL